MIIPKHSQHSELLEITIFSVSCSVMLKLRRDTLESKHHDEEHFYSLQMYTLLMIARMAEPHYIVPWDLP